MGRQGLRHLGERLLRPREVVQIDQFLKETAAREASAKLRLQQFIEELLERADRAERQLQVISSSCGSTPSASLGRGGGGGGAGPGPRGPGRMVSVHLPSCSTCTPAPSSATVCTAWPGVAPYGPCFPSLAPPCKPTSGLKEGSGSRGAPLTARKCQPLRL